jgi:hypothetical protein
MRSDGDPAIQESNGNMKENFPLLRSRTEFFPSSALTTSTDNTPPSLHLRIAHLEKILTEMRFRLEEMEEDTGTRTRWGVRYSRRMAILANILIGLWRFLEVFLDLLQKRRRQIMHSLLSRKADKLNENINKVFQMSYMSGIRRSVGYLLCALLLYSKYPWKRSMGLFLSSAMSLWYVYWEPHQVQLAHYITLFANILYGTASWSLAYKGKREKPNAPQIGLEERELSAYARFKEFFRKTIEHF